MSLIKGDYMSRVFFSLGGVTIYWYSIMILLAVLVGMFIVNIESKKNNMKDYFDNLLFYLIIFGVIGARIYYVIFEFDKYKYDLLSIFKVWEGGLAIYGAIIAGLIVIIYYAIKNETSILKTTDILVPGLIIGQAIGRWGNFFNHEAHGAVVSLAYLKKIHIPSFIIKGMHINGIYYHPTFLYESLWCLIGFLILLLIRKKFNKFEGLTTYIYFIWYGVGRFFIEGLRTDSLYIGSIRVSQLVSVLLIMVGISGIFVKIFYNKKEEIE